MESPALVDGGSTSRTDKDHDEKWRGSNHAERKGQPPGPAAADIRFVPEPTGWPRLAAPPGSACAFCKRSGSFPLVSKCGSTTSIFSGIRGSVLSAPAVYVAVPEP